VAGKATTEAGIEFGLTERERGVVELILREDSTKEIADRLGCSIKTVEFHVTNILRKVGARTRVGLVLRLVGAKGVSDEDARLRPP
jgi:DNA-binding CsgD family transcriptional regulator